MNRYRVNFHTGPCAVEHFALKVQDHVADLVRGTERIYFTIEGVDIEDALATAKQFLGEPRGISISPLIQR